MSDEVVVVMVIGLVVAPFDQSYVVKPEGAVIVNTLPMQMLTVPLTAGVDGVSIGFASRLMDATAGARGLSQELILSDT